MQNDVMQILDIHFYMSYISQPVLSASYHSMPSKVIYVAMRSGAIRALSQLLCIAYPSLAFDV